MYTYIIVDDNPYIIEQLMEGIDNLYLKINLVGKANSIEEAYILVHNHYPDIILLNIDLCDFSYKKGLGLIRQKFPEQRIIIISSRLEYSNMKAAIEAGADDYLLKPLNSIELKSAFDKSISVLAQQQIKSELTKELNCKQDEEKLSEYLLSEENNFPLLKSQFWQAAQKAACFRIVLLSGDAKSLISKMVDNNTGVFKILRSPALTLIVFLSPYSDKKINEFKEMINYKVLKSVKISFSKSYADIINLKSAFRYCRNLIDGQPLCKNMDTIIYDEYIKSPRIEWNKEKHLFFSIESGNPDDAKYQLKDLFSYLDDSEIYSLGAFKRYAVYLIKSIRELVFGHIGGSIRGSSDSRNIEWCYDYYQIKECLMNTVINSANALKPYGIYSSGIIIQDIIRYIEKNYMNNISLDILSELFYINPSYCSTLFKKHMSINYSQYLNKIRIKKACELLCNSRLKTSQIARSVGFSNEEYFFRVFKKTTEYTPLQYRKKFCTAEEKLIN